MLWSFHSNASSDNASFLGSRHSPVRPVHYSSSLWNFLRKKKAGTFWNKYKQNQVTIDQMDLSTLSFICIFIIIINWYYNLFQVRNSKEGEVFLFCFWILFFSIILIIAQNQSFTSVAIHPALLSIPHSSRASNQQSGKEHSARQWTLRPDSHPKSFPIDKVSYVNNLSQISLTTFQTFSEKETNLSSHRVRH